MEKTIKFVEVSWLLRLANSINMISKTLENFTDKIAYRFSGRNRARKFELFMKLVAPTKRQSILDIGFDDNEYSATDNYLEKHYPWPEKITALSDQAPKNFKKLYPMVKAVTYDGVDFPFRNKQFALGWSNAVIEHVGDYEKQLHFLREIKRTCKKAYITTPNRWFPVEVHTRIPLLHYLPKKYFDKILKLFGMDWATEDYVHLLSLARLEKLLKEAKIENYRLFKSRLFGLTLDYIIYFEVK